MNFESKKFTVRLDKNINRIYLKPIGFWGSVSIAEDYSDKVREAVAIANKGFTVLIDLTAFKIPKTEILDIIKSTQAFLTKSGMLKAAEINAQNPFTNLAVDQLKKEKAYAFDLRQKFDEIVEAEAWLNVAS